MPEDSTNNDRCGVCAQIRPEAQQGVFAFACVAFTWISIISTVKGSHHYDVQIALIL